MFNYIDMSLSALLGVVVGYSVTRLIVGKKEEEVVSVETVSKSRDIVKPKEVVEKVEEPKDFSDLVRFLKDKYMLSEVTLSTYEGLPIASTLDDPEEISALAPEILKDVGGILKSKEVIIGGKYYKMCVFEVTPEVICTIQTTRDVPFVEIDRIREEIRRFMEVKT